MALQEALRRHNHRLYDAERRVTERAEWVKVRDGVVGGREMAVSRREEDVAWREVEVQCWLATALDQSSLQTEGDDSSVNYIHHPFTHTDSPPAVLFTPPLLPTPDPRMLNSYTK